MDEYKEAANEIMDGLAHVIDNKPKGAILLAMLAVLHHIVQEAPADEQDPLRMQIRSFFEVPVPKDVQWN